MAAGASFAPENTNAAVYLYIADTSIHSEPGGAGSHVHLYSNVVNEGMGFGTMAADSADKYVSAATVSGCEKCHGAPYMKHGYRGAAAGGLPDFAACKTCHYDDRTGGHQDWQIFVDNPARYAEIHAGADLTAEEESMYAYTANVMNDTHMSHIMEFPYPQSGKTCVTCHEGKLDMILTDEMMTLTTCKSCHPMTGGTDTADADGDFTVDTTGIALTNITPHPLPADGICNTCHSASGFAPTFNQIHTGYDTVIYADAAGTRYADVFNVTIDSASYADGIITAGFSAHKMGAVTDLNAEDIIPTIMIGLYSANTKDYIVGPHERDADRNRLGEFTVDGESVNPRFTVVSSGGGSWEVQWNMTEWADWVAAGTVSRCEIAIMPELLDASGTTVALNAPNRTFDLITNSFDDGYFAPITDVNNCNVCHDALATSFHGPDRGGSVVVCRMCHITKSRGSHLELQSRSIDSYVHAIHSFQAFDPGDVDFSDPVEATRYDIHINHTYPLFTITACESCHNPGTYNVPDQSKSLAGVLSGSDDVAGRNIGEIPQYVTGPGSRACGACHRSDMINADDAGRLISLLQHTKDNGYLIEDADGVLMDVIEKIAAYFD